ncbi:MAG: DNA polymerase III subunit alpha [Pseudomonadota bacterium]
MTSPAFIHLRMHSEYSVVDSSITLASAIQKAVAFEMPALGLSDLNNTFGWIKFYQSARGAGLKPLFGVDTWMMHSDATQPYRVLLLCANQQGYRHVCEWLTRAYISPHVDGHATVQREWLWEAPNEGVIVLSGARCGDAGQAITQGRHDDAKTILQGWANAFPSRFYIELQRAGHPDDESCVKGSILLASELNLPVVATHPIQFLEPESFKAHEARICIAESYTMGDPRRPKTFHESQYFQTSEAMQRLFADIPSALTNSVEIAKRCNLIFKLGKPALPQFPTPEGMGLDDFLRQQSTEGLEKRLEHLAKTSSLSATREAYFERLDFEIKTIIHMGFPGYFLIVADFINWAKNNGVPVGPGRGSGAGSLVAYALNITDLDPLRYQLLFERFLNPERVSMPDFDIDFCQDGRERVIEYVRHYYGAASVSQIATFGTMAAKGVIRDVGRVLDLPYNFVDQISKLIPLELGITLTKAREQEPLINQRCEEEEEVAELFELAMQLEGITRNVGMHAGGVLIAPGKLTDFCPLYAADGSPSVVSQYDKDDVEAVGLVKFDFLGLRTLTILDWAVRFVQRLDPSFSLHPNDLPLDDKDVYKLLCKGNTTAVFQLESRGMKDMLKQAKPDRFEDIIALVSLYRPGPMDLIPDFIRRKHGLEKVEYPDPRLQPILGATYGIMVYQEQVMQIAQVIGGYTLGGADLLRRAMGKKKADEMATHRGIFVEGAAKNGVAAEPASQLFDVMEKFAGYGFNKSHAAAYALVAYQTAWFKAHHPAAFMSATLSSEMDDTDKLRIFYEDTLAQGVSFLPPDVNHSEYRFTPVDPKTIRYGLGAIKGSGEAAINAIIEARQSGGAFTDLFDFCKRIDKRTVNRRTIESLIKAGAFDPLNPSRGQLFAHVSKAMEWAEQQARDKNQMGLFGGEGEDTTPHYDATPAWSVLEALQHEKTSLGFYFSGHPFNAYETYLAGWSRTSLKKLAPGKELFKIAGVILSIRTQLTKRGKMAFILLDDGTGSVELSVFAAQFDSHKHWLKEDALLMAEVKVHDDAYTGGVRVSVDNLMNLEMLYENTLANIQLTCDSTVDGEWLVSQLKIAKNISGVPLIISYKAADIQGKVILPDTFKIRCEQPWLDRLLGHPGIRFKGSWKAHPAKNLSTNRFSE